MGKQLEDPFYKKVLETEEPLDRIYQKEGCVVSEQIGDTLILVPILNQTADMERCFSLNGTGARVWELIDGSRQLREIHGVLVEEFDVTSEKARRDLLQLLDQLAAARLVSRVGVRRGTLG